MSLAADEDAGAVPPIFVPAPAEAHPAWSDDVACASTPDGLSFAQWFDDHYIDEERLFAFASAVPLSRVYGVIDEAQRRMVLWDRLAQMLQERVRAQTPSGRAARRWGTQPAAANV